MKYPVLLMARELHLGGSERQLAEVALGLDRSRFEAHVGTFRPQGFRGDQLRAGGIPVVQFPVRSFRSGTALAGMWQLARYIRRHNIRLVHAFDTPLTLFATLVTRFLTSATMLSSQRGSRELMPEYRGLLRWTDHLVDGIVVNCQYLKTHLIEDERVPPPRIQVCYNGIDLDQFHSGPALRPAALPEDALVIGVVCVLRPEKGLATLVDAFARIRSLRPSMKLVMVGSGPVLEVLQAQAKEAGVVEDCVWEPATADVPRWLRNFDIFVLPSLSEALSNSLMEAMACGCPVIASNVGGNPELIEHGVRGLLFEPRNSAALAEALRRLIDDEALRRTFADAGERFIRGHFSRQTSADHMGEIYQAFIERPGPGPPAAGTVVSEDLTSVPGSKFGSEGHLRKIRVLLIAPSMHILGGQAVQATRLLDVLGKFECLKAGFQSINPRLPGPLRVVHSVPYVRTVVTFLIYCCMLLARAWRYDLLHVFSASYYSYNLWTLPALVCAKLYRKKIVLHYHDGQVEDHLKNWPTAVPSLRRMDRIVAPSGFVGDVFRKYGFAPVVIHNIVDPAQFQFRLRSQPGPIFLHNRILEPLYNAQCALRAFRLVQDRYAEARLTVANDGICRPSLERLARELRLQNTTFIGRVPHERISDLYDEAEIYLTSSNFDCMPLSLLECFASGLPVIATKSGGIPDMVEHNRTGLLVDCDDHRAMADCAFRLLETESPAETLTRNAFGELQKYSATGIGNQWLELYQETLGDHP